ncbi:hypothetical protein [Streptomyces capitiformicae]|uniref:Uncharacterized protein n=1 Tax=Streptomyces capitiformicae TaxID=2014920 RepID=A0A919GPG7_9ACTN|nr:hypothetical protein [Streptomyces capitiformicae]GHH87828.1 hypothetical protein GCM10017771_30580 [Streptomyces capitiformicae]
MAYDDDLAKPQDHVRIALKRCRPTVPRWYQYSYTATGLEYWLRFLIGEPREFVYVVPRRLACRLFKWHSPTCVGRGAPHPRRW